ncbi:MAG: RidA family protein [Candidatus Zixiibacteriota bacterium]|nr:MAG: RidA family protein [candidate division Zixibacteria bacterium]
MRQIIRTDQAPAAIGPYNQAVVGSGTLVFTAGQIPLDLDGNLVGGGVAEQTRQVLENLKQVLGAAGSSLRQVVKTTVFLQNMDDFAAMNAVYAEYFDEMPPARSTVQVARLPKAALVEIEAIALVG